MKLPFKFDEAALNSLGWVVAHLVGYKDGHGGLYRDNPADRTIELVNLGKKITIYVTYSTDTSDDYTCGVGHVWFDLGGKNYGFDRRGIDVSFYVNYLGAKKTYGTSDLNELVALQVERVETSRERDRLEGGRIVVPGTRIEITLKRKAELSTSLKLGKDVSITPSGFGTGYNVSVKMRTRWATKSPAMAEFFGVPTAWFTSIDCD